MERHTVLDLRDIADDKLLAGAKGAKPADLDPDVCRRAVIAFLKSVKGQVVPVVLAISYGDKLYVALHNDVGVHCIYRVRNDLQLKRMRRIPEQVAYMAELDRRAASNRSQKYA